MARCTGAVPSGVVMHWGDVMSHQLSSHMSSIGAVHIYTPCSAAGSVSAPGIELQDGVSCSMPLLRESAVVQWLTT